MPGDELPMDLVLFAMSLVLGIALTLVTDQRPRGRGVIASERRSGVTKERRSDHAQNKG